MRSRKRRRSTELATSSFDSLALQEQVLYVDIKNNLLVATGAGGETLNDLPVGRPRGRSS